MKKLNYPAPFVPSYLQVKSKTHSNAFILGLNVYDLAKIKRWAEAPFSPPGRTTFPNTAHTSFLLSYQLQIKNNPV